LPLFDKMSVIVDDTMLPVPKNTLAQDGIPILYYGDEIAEQNSFQFLESEAASRQAYFKKEGVEALGARDSRDVNRGSLSREGFEDAAAGKGSALANETFQATQNVIAARKYRVDPK
jgi:hypothetical protein